MLVNTLFIKQLDHTQAWTTRSARHTGNEHRRWHCNSKATKAGRHTVKFATTASIPVLTPFVRYAKGLTVGSKVQQGQVIGYVGSTGASTGAHLDFRVWKNNTPINPLTMESPPVEPIPQKYMTEFKQLRDSLIQKIDTVQFVN